MRMLVGAILIIAICMPARAAVAQRQAELPWWQRAAEAKVGEYWIKTDLPADEANTWARHLNIMYREYARRLASLPPREPEVLHVLIFAKQNDYLRVMRARYGIDGTGTGGMFFITAQGKGLALFTENLARRRIEHVIQHEGFHQFAWSRFGGDLPIWVNEGLAEFFGQSVFVNDKLVLGQSQKRVLDNIKAAIETRDHMPFLDMLNMTPHQWGHAVHAGDAELQYNQAWSMVHFLVYADEGRYTAHFERYLRLLNGGVQSEPAFIRVFGDDLAAFEQRWIEYAGNARPSAFLTAMERIEFQAAGLLELSGRKIYPASLEVLRERLRDINFTLKLDRHGTATVLRADDDAMFDIPMDDLTTEQPIFIVEPHQPGRRQTRQDRILEQQNPTPPIIRTANLRPRGLSIRWVRDPETNVFTYRIDAR